MKKAVLIIMAVSLLLIGGCTKKSPEQEKIPDVNTKETDTNEKKESEKIEHKLLDEVETDGYNKIDEVFFDFDADGEDDLLELFSTMELIDGDLMGDDTNSWLLTVTTQNGVYKLYDDYIQNGIPDLDICTIYNPDAKPFIIFTNTQGSGKSIVHYTFEDGVFWEEKVYEVNDYAKNGISIFENIRVD